MSHSPLEPVLSILPHGYTIYKQKNEAGGYNYWTDEVVGIMYFDSAIQDIRIMKTILKLVEDET